MIKMIQYLEENTAILELFKKGEVSLVGVSAVEQQAILDAFEENVYKISAFWS